MKRLVVFHLLGTGLADEYEYKSNVANIHYTLGGPWFNDAFRSDYEQEWIYYYKKMGG